MGWLNSSIESQMKNITVTVDDELYRQARIAAAERGVTLTALVRQFLLQEIRGLEVDRKYLKRNQALDRAFAAVDSCDYSFGRSDTVSREELYGRGGIR